MKINFLKKISMLIRYRRELNSYKPSHSLEKNSEQYKIYFWIDQE